MRNALRAILKGQFSVIVESVGRLLIIRELVVYACSFRRDDTEHPANKDMRSIKQWRKVCCRWH